MQRIAIVIALVGLMLAIVIGAPPERPLEPSAAIICLFLGGLVVAVATAPEHKDK